MGTPTILPAIGGYDLAWTEGVKIKVTHLHVHNSDSRVTGELLISDKKAILYPQTQINFSADRTRNALVKSLSERYPKYQWIGIIDQLCYQVQEKAREGEPVVDLLTSEEVIPPQYLVYPLVLANQPNVLFGPPESGKTQIGLALCLIMILPWVGNPLGLGVPEKPLHPLWLDYEADRDTTLWNFRRIANGAGAEGVALSYRRCRIPLADDVEQIAYNMEKVKADCLVIDSVGKAAGGDLDKSESPTRLFSAIDQLRCTTILLAHTSKGDLGRKTIYGSTFFEAYSRSIFELRASRDGETLKVGIWDNKANFRGKIEPRAYSISYDEDHIFFNIEDIKTIDDFMRHLSISSRILEALKDGSKSPGEIKEHLSDVAAATFYAELARMAKKNKLVKIGLGKDLKYGLPYYGSQPI